MQFALIACCLKCLKVDKVLQNHRASNLIHAERWNVRFRNVTGTTWAGPLWWAVVPCMGSVLGRERGMFISLDTTEMFTDLQREQGKKALRSLLRLAFKT